MNQINILFVDIDGTLTTTKSGKPFKQSPDDIKPIYGAKKAIEHFHNRGYKIFGISNQGGCDTVNKETGKPFKSVDDTILEMQNTIKLFSELDSIYFCPKMDGLSCVAIHNPDLTRYISFDDVGIYRFRKPDIGMVNEVIMIYQDTRPINKQQSLFVGDREEDRQCAENAGIPFMDAEMWRFKYGSF